MHTEIQGGWSVHSVATFAIAHLDVRNRKPKQRLPACRRKLCAVRNQHDDSKNASPGQAQHAATLHMFQKLESISKSTI
jgi:hypothetical protein